MLLPSFDDIEDFVVLTIHIGVVGLHFCEVHQQGLSSLAGLISISYISLESYEAYHVRRKIVRRHKRMKKEELGK